MPISRIAVRQHVFILIRLPGLGANCWNAADVDLSLRRSPLRNLKYESYSKPEAPHSQLRIIWLLSIVTQPLQSQECEGPRVEAEHCLANGLM
ncbi:hypothetical protein EFP00_11150, partial [Lactiplantibacillus paraplantarum]|nr:hypothetical protein [Lactiplantibacillus paraplantarum]